MFVKVKTATGVVQYVPEHWLAHPVLGEGLTRVGKPRKSRRRGSNPIKPHVRGEETNQEEGVGNA